MSHVRNYGSVFHSVHVFPRDDVSVACTRDEHICGISYVLDCLNAEAVHAKKGINRLIWF